MEKYYFLNRLEENWYDSYESMRDLTEEALTRMKIPDRLSQLIITKIRNVNPSQETANKSKIIEEPKFSQEKTKKPEISKENSEILGFLEEYRKNVTGNDLFIESLKTLGKYLQNVVDFQNDEKYRKIKIGNKLFLEKIRPYEAALNILKFVKKYQYFQDIYIKNQRWDLIPMRVFSF